MPRPLFLFRLFPALAVALVLAGCADSPTYHYTYVPGKTAVMHGAHAVAPAGAPPCVKQAIEAGNRIAGLPYRYGGGHARHVDSAYDCSGATSFVLREAGLLETPIPSTSFRRYGEGGKGDWISVYARKGHVFLVVAGLRFDTGWGGRAKGPRWTKLDRPINECVIRHPVGL